MGSEITPFDPVIFKYMAVLVGVLAVLILAGLASGAFRRDPL